VREVLRFAGIEARVTADDAGGAYPFPLAGGADVVIDESDREAASEVLAGQAEER
jgi:hypothetical protein